MTAVPQGAGRTPRLNPSIAAAWTRTPASPRFWALLAAYNVALGVFLAAGGKQRVAGPSFETIRDYGGHITWGSALVVIGVVIAAGPFIGQWFLGYSLAVAAILHLLLAAGFVAAAVAAPNASLTGPPTYLFVATSMALHAGHYLRTARTS